MRIVAICEECHHWHPIDFDPLKGYANAASDWWTKHNGHQQVKFEWPTRSLKQRLFGHAGRNRVSGPKLDALLANSNVKLVYAASAAYTITLASLATSSTLVAGRQSTALSNASNLYLDEILAGLVTTGTTPTVNTTIEVWVVGCLDDTPTWPDTFGATDAGVTVSSRAQLNAYGKPVSSILANASSNIGYPFGPLSIAQQFGGVLPVQHDIWVVHSTAANLNSTGGNHYVKGTGCYGSVI